MSFATFLDSHDAPNWFVAVLFLVIVAEMVMWRMAIIESKRSLAMVDQVLDELDEAIDKNNELMDQGDEWKNGRGTDDLGSG